MEGAFEGIQRAGGTRPVTGLMALAVVGFLLPAEAHSQDADPEELRARLDEVREYLSPPGPASKGSGFSGVVLIGAGTRLP